MKRTFFQKFIATGVVIAAALGTATVAQARPEVFVSIGLPALPLPPLPVFAPPLPRPVIQAPVYVEPRPVYVQPRPVYQPAPVVVYDRPWQPAYRYEAERDREWRHREWQRREWERRHDGDRPHHRHDRYGRD